MKRDRNGAQRENPNANDRSGRRPESSRRERITIEVSSDHVQVRGEDNPTRRAFYRWIVGIAAQAVETASPGSLEAAVTAPSMRSGLLDVVDALPPPSDVSEVTLLREEALAKGLRARQDLEDRAGGLWTTALVAGHLGMTRQAIDRKRRSGKLLAIRRPDGTYQYPFAQFDEAGVVPGLEQALAAFVIDDPWMQLAALVNPSHALSDRSILDTLREAGNGPEREKAIAIIRSYFAG